jgi:hypothetical protein
MKKFLYVLVVGVLVFLLTGCGGGGGGGPSGPTVSILSPTNNATVSGTITIEATATSSIGVRLVEFYVDDNKVGEVASPPYTYSWNADTFPYGTKHSIYARAQDNAGNWGSSPKISITIGDSQAPQITLTSPQSNIVPVSALIPIRVSIQDRGKKTKAPSGIQKVEFFVDGNKLGEVPGNSQTSGTFECPNLWDTSGLKHNTTHTITVKATDNVGLVGESTFQVTANAEWTILIYADAHTNPGEGDLHQDLQIHLNDLQSNLTSTQGINVVVLAGANPDYVFYYHNGTFDPVVALSQPINFGDPNNLASFLNAGIQSYPAKKYLFLLWDHGSGWRKRSAKRDICFDEYYSNDALDLSELKQAFQTAVNLLGRKIDVVVLNACLMGTIEVDYQLKDLVDYLVSSEASMWDAPLWGESLKKLVSNPGMSPRDLAITIADTFYNQAYKAYQSGVLQGGATIAAKDPSMIDKIADDIYYFAHYLRDCVPSYAQAIMNLRDNTTKFSPFSNGSPYYIDLYEFASLVANNTTYDALKTAAQNLTHDIDTSLIYCKYFGFNCAKGYSIWFPRLNEFDQDSANKYLDLDFAKSTSGTEWRYFLYDELNALSSSSLGKEARGKTRSIHR